MDQDHISYREEQRKQASAIIHETLADVIQEQMAAAGLVDCPSCGNEVPESSVERCRCGTRICKLCGIKSRVDGVEDELVCGPACEKTSLEAALQTLTRQFDRDQDALQAKYDTEIQPIIHRLAELLIPPFGNGLAAR